MKYFNYKFADHRYVHFFQLEKIVHLQAKLVNCFHKWNVYCEAILNALRWSVLDFKTITKKKHPNISTWLIGIGTFIEESSTTNTIIGICSSFYASCISIAIMSTLRTKSVNWNCYNCFFFIEYYRILNFFFNEEFSRC